MTSAGAILFSEMTPPAEFEDVFNAWYDDEHIPLRMGAPGFRSAQRYRDGGSRNYLTIYEIDGPEALATPQYRKIKDQPSELTSRMLGSVSGFTRYIGRNIGVADLLPDAPVIYPVFFNVPSDRVEEFDDWYDKDHVPVLRQDARWQGVRRFEIIDGLPRSFNRLAVHYLADRAVLDSDARRRARETPWRARLAAEPWFQGHYLVFDSLGRRHVGRAEHQNGVT
jgi:hypothetical protein